MKKVTKATIKAILKKGKEVEIWLLPNKVGFNNCWICPIMVTVKSETNLENVLAHYEYYNCNSELGKKVAIYIEE